MKKILPKPKRKAETAAGEKPVALTVKIDQEMYIRLSMLRAKERRTAQEILTEALDAYLDQAEARK
jgi:predicted transcriptional regulator